MTPRWRTGMERLVELVRVEMQGKVSIGRVVAVARYTERTSTFRKAAVLLLSPVPSLMVTLLGELIPLAPPDTKHRRHWGYLFRLWYSIFVFSYITIRQFSHYLQSLPASELQLFVRALAVATATVACDYAVIDLLVFPVPFSLASLSSIWAAFVLGDMALVWGRIIFERYSELKQIVINTFKVWGCQFALVGIYPVYYFVFGLLGSSERVLLMFLLPVIKIVLRTWFGNSVIHLRDELPEVVVTNVDVFNALFMMYCMQITPSLTTTLGLMILDFAQSTLALHDLRSILSEVNKSYSQINTRWVTLPRSYSYVARAAAIISPTCRFVVAVQDDSMVVDKRIRTTCQLHQVQPAQMQQKKKATLISSQPTVGDALPARLVSPMDVTMIGAGSRQQSTLCSTDLEEARFVDRVRQLMYVADFLLLLNYVEFAIPAIYATYLAALYHLPSCIYFPLIASMTTEHLNSTLVNLYSYAGLELFSLVLLHIVLSQVFHLPGLPQLAHTLDSQWIGVQSKLVFWVLYNAQTPLKHSGFDYSFKFAWLYASNLTDQS